MLEHESFKRELKPGEKKCGNCQAVYESSKKHCPMCNVANNDYKR